MVDPSKVLEKTDEQKNPLETLLHLIPGYRGYQDRERIRESDRLVREELYRHLRTSERNLNQLFNELVDSSSDQNSRADRLKIKCDRIAESIRHAQYGYAGLFNAVKIREDELNTMTQFDASLLDHVVKIEVDTDSAKRKTKSVQELQTLLQDVDDSLDELETTFAERKQRMQGLDK